ncbi:mono/diheme cytochrome c family protein [Chromatocurvus halotolerans]|uniref:Mono/diheme cytochrome c family protein n=2 Tax=Chromatocurvus halotolerans TaxID=1132028 RepID=A0A4R2KW41_9GAMM|nr:mono/diheme cytochrome c family protein [Chromatocurvus halotolerans]
MQIAMNHLFRVFVVTSALALTLGSGAAARAQDVSDEQLARGEILARAGNCAACHTADNGEPYAGGRSISTPFGVLNTANITPHSTGIADYTFEDFVASLREGKNASGDAMYPAHPYPFFTRMMDADLEALWTFLQTIEPIDNEVEIVQLGFPFNLRTGVAAWQAANFEPERFEPRDDKSDEWNRGAYLVQAVTHCGACHTPRNATFATDDTRHLEGSVIQGWYAPDISAGDTSVIDDWSVDEILHFLREGETDYLETSYGPMDDVVHESLAKIPEDAVRAIAVYLRDVAPEQAKEPDDPGGAGRVGDGEGIFIANCSGCHLLSGEGMAGAAATLNNNRSITTLPPNNIIMSVLAGLPPDKDWGGMPSFINVLSNSEIAEVSNYVRTAWDNDASPNATPRLVDSLRSEVRDAPGFEPWSAMCANLPRSQIDSEFITRIGGVSRDGFADPEIEDLVRAYAGRFPEVDAGTALIAISSGYCRYLSEEDVERDDALRRISRFNTRLASVIGDQMPRMNDD